jgi:RNA polymerase sigma-70 factor (ECF subfamily)
MLAGSRTGSVSKSDAGFAEFLRRIRAGDAQAAEELVRLYELPIRVAVRTRMTDPALQQQFDSMDICQSVLASFFLRANAGQYDLTEPAQLVALLVRMAQNKLAWHARYYHRQRRDARQTASLDGATELTACEPDPARVVASRDLLDALRSRLTPEERELVDRRGEGRSWNEIAAALGGTADGRRMQLKRAVDRIAPQLGLEGEEGFDV